MHSSSSNLIYGTIDFTLSLNLDNKPLQCALVRAAPPWLYVLKDKQSTTPHTPSAQGWRACIPRDVHRFLLTLPFVEPQHTASKHRHGRGHEEGEGSRRPMELWLVTLSKEIRQGGGGEVWVGSVLTKWGRTRWIQMHRRKDRDERGKKVVAIG